MSMKIGELIDNIIEYRSNGNSAIAEMTKSKLILKGIKSDDYELKCCDAPEIVEKLIEIRDNWNCENIEDDTSSFITAFSRKKTPGEVVLDIQSQMNRSNIKVLIYFAAPSHDQENLSRLMTKGFDGSVVFGCSSAGEKVDDKLLTDSVVALGLTSKIVADAKVEVIENLNNGINIHPVFNSFSRYFNESTYTMDIEQYVGITLIDGLSKKEERVMDEIGNATNVRFVGGSAADYLKFEETLVYANGKCYSDSAIVALIKLQKNASFNIINTQSFYTTNAVLVANKVDEESRQVIEFNNQPAANAYADALGISPYEIEQQFFTHPVGLVINEDNILVRSPRHKVDSKLEFSANILEGMEVSVLEPGDIVQGTKDVVTNIQKELGDRLAGIISFDCIYRRLEIDSKQLVNEYGAIFKDIPSIGLCAYGEVNIGFMNQTSTMLILEYESNTPCEAKTELTDNNETLKLNEENKKLKIKIDILEKRLEQATEELKIFNSLLEDEINKRTKKEKKIAYLSYHDELTGLYNRRYIEKYMSKDDNKDNLPISIIVGDVNNLKIMNETLGNGAGDKLLKEVAKTLKSACRQGDIIARFGGDEFIILLPRTPYKGAERVVQRIKELSENKTIEGHPVSVSLGWATKEISDEKIIERFNEAEKKMYINKSQKKIQGWYCEVIRDVYIL